MVAPHTSRRTRPSPASATAATPLEFWIIKDIFLVDILLRVGEAAKQKRVGRYFVFIGKVKGGGRGLRLCVCFWPLVTDGVL